MSSCVHGINAYVKKLQVIQEACGKKKVAGQEAEPKDEFVRNKLRMYMLIEDVRDGVRDRQAVIKRRGICHETINKGHENRQKMAELQRSLPQMQQLHKKAMGKRSAAQNKEELAARYQDLRVLKRHVDEVRELIEGTNADMEDVGTRPELFGLREAGRGDPDIKRDLTDDEKQALADMRARDEKIDQQAGEIGDVVQRLVPLAEQIGVTAERQKAQADTLTSSVDKNLKEIERQSEFTKELIKYEKSTTQCCQMVLGLLLLCVIGFIFNQIGLG